MEVRGLKKDLLTRRSSTTAGIEYLAGRKTNMEVQPVATALTGELISNQEQLSRAEYETKKTVKRAQTLVDGSLKITTTDYFMTVYNASGKQSVVYSTGQYVDIMI